jgi:hypothetical protein
MQSNYASMMDAVTRTEQNEETVSGNIAFLPGQFTSVEKLMKDLAVVKRSYDIEVLEREAEYVLTFEGDAAITVQKPAWAEFVESFNRYVHTIGSVPGVYAVDLGGFLAEGAESEVKGLKESLIKLLTETVLGKSLAYVQESLEHIQLLFPGNTLATESAVFPRRNVTDIAEELVKELGEDLGGMQMVMDALEQGLEASDLPVFERCPFLWGVTHTFEIKGLSLAFESFVGRDYLPIASVQIKDLELRESLRAVEGLKTLQDLVIAESGVFDYRSLERIKEAVVAITGEA